MADVSHNGLVQHLGLPQSTVDSNGVGPAQFWFRKLPSGLCISVLRFPFATATGIPASDNELAPAEVYANRADLELVRRHLPAEIVVYEP